MTLNDLRGMIDYLIYEVGGGEAADDIPVVGMHQSNYPLRERIAGVVVHGGEAVIVLDGHPNDGSPYGSKKVWDDGDGRIGSRLDLKGLPESVGDWLREHTDSEEDYITEIRMYGPESEESMSALLRKAQEHTGVEFDATIEDLLLESHHAPDH